MKKNLLIVLTLMMTLGLFAQTMTTPQGSGTETDPYEIASYENLNWLTSRAEDSEVPFLDRLSSYYIQTQDIEFPTEITQWDDNQGFLPIGYGTLAETFAFSGTYDGQGHTISNLYINRPTTEDYVGLFGLLITGTIQNVGLVDVDITGSWGAAGFVGEMDTNSLITNCFATGDIVGEAFVGGITGYNFESEINNSYFIGTADGLEGVAGIAGFTDLGTITNSYAVATVPETDYAGIITGLADGATIENTFWDSTIADGIDGIWEISESEIVNVEGKTTEEMQTQATFTDAGWDFTDTWQIDSDINSSYPSFVWQTATEAPESYYPPSNLTAEVLGSEVELSWEAPIDLSQGVWLTKSAEENNDGIGVDGPAEFGVAHMYTEAELAMYQGLNIQSIKFFPREASATYQVAVWGGADGQTLLHSEDVATFTNEAWNEHQLTLPVAIPTEGPVYIGYLVNTPAGFPAGCDAGPAVAGGDMIHFVGDPWSPLAQIAAIDVNWNIQAFVSSEGGDRLASKMIVTANKPAQVNQNHAQFVAGNLNPIATSIRNNVTRDVTGYKVYRDETEIAEVTADVFTYTDSGLEDGTYEYYVTALYGDTESEASNTVTVDIININPDDVILADSFESYTDFALQFGEWTLVDGDLSGTYGFSGIAFPNAEGMMAYTVFNPMQTTPPLDDPGYEAADGSKYLASFAAVTPPNNDWLISQPFWVGPNGGDVMFTAKSITNQYGLERFNVLVSDGSTNPNDFTNISGTSYVEAPMDWTNYSYSLDDYSDQIIRVAVQCVSNDAFVFMLDDFKVLSPDGIVDNNDNNTPQVTASLSNYPNPFNPETTINYSVVKAGKVTLEVYNVLGQKVKTLVNDTRDAGSHSVVWNGQDDAGKNVSSGVYFYRLKNGSQTNTNKMILMK